MPPRRLRLDAELVRRGLARSREHASELVGQGRVKVSGVPATKPATAVTTDVAIVVADDPDRPDYVSRGGHKLAGALAAFAPAGLVVAGRRCLDAGASTGGFTDVLLRHGAAEVVAVDVGYGQLAWKLQQDDRVVVHDRTNVRELTPELVGGPVDVVVGDLSFISLELVLDALLGVTAPDGDLALMVKPQFEVGKDRVGKGGVVRDPELRAEAVSSVAAAAAARGWGARMVATSPLPGPSGNVEFFLWLRRGPATLTAEDIHTVVRGADPLGVPGEKVDPVITSDPTATRRVLLVAHTGREEAREVARSFAKALTAHGLVVRLLAGEARDLGLEAGRDGIEVVTEDQDPSAGAELALVIGGDGTILRAAELAHETGTPLLGVNLGHVGFLAEAEHDDVESTIDAIVHRRYTAEDRLTIDVTVHRDGEIVTRTWALNEASVEKAARERMLEVVVEIDGRPLSRWGCDGVVFSTPTGSTAYNFSAGGPIVWPGVEALLMVPISAHALFARPMVVAPTSVLAVEVLAHTEGSGVMWCDGRRAVDLPPGARIEVRRGQRPVRLVRLHEAPFTDRLVAKFDLPVEGWRGSSERRRRMAEDTDA